MNKRNIALVSLLATVFVLSVTLTFELSAHAESVPQTITKSEVVRVTALTYRAAGIFNSSSWSPIVIPFEFNPKDNFLYVTKAWVNVVANVNNTGAGLSIKLNNQPIWYGYLVNQQMLIPLLVDNSDVLQTITPGINTLTTIVDQGSNQTIFEAEVLIDYCFQPSG